MQSQGGQSRRPDAWARRHRRLLNTVFLHFAESGEWPKAQELQRELVRRSDALDVLGETRELPAELGWTDQQDRIVLTPRALGQVEAARDLLDDYVRVVELAFRRYRDGRGAVRLTVDDIERSLSLSGRRANRTVGLMKTVPSLFAAPNDSQSLGVLPDIRHFGSVAGLADYVAVQRRLGRSHQANGAPASGRPVRDWLGRKAQTVLDKIVIGVIVAVIVAIGAMTIRQVLPDERADPPVSREGGGGTPRGGHR